MVVGTYYIYKKSLDVSEGSVIDPPFSPWDSLVQRWIFFQTFTTRGARRIAGLCSSSSDQGMSSLLGTLMSWECNGPTLPGNEALLRAY